MKKLFCIVALIAALPLFGNDSAVPALQSGSRHGDRPIHAAGIMGQGEIVGVLDTGLDWDSCYFAEPDGSPPPVNTVNPDGSLQRSNIDPTRRKVIAYDFLFSCEEYPDAEGCDAAAFPDGWDNQGHGTHAAGAIAADRAQPLVWDDGDAIAPAAKLVIQDAGFIGGDACSQRPGLRCPVRDLGEVLSQAYDQGVRIHSNSWGDRQGAGLNQTPPTANYNDWTAQIDQFVFDHPDMLVVFNSGNAGQLGDSSVSSPGSAKNTLQVGGFRWYGDEPAVLYWSGSGPTRDGRLKPELIAPAFVFAADSDLDVTTNNCHTTVQGGTSWSAPIVAGAAALVRQYYRDGFLKHGSASGSGFDPSSALLKATLVASSRPAAYFDDGQGSVPDRVDVKPSFDQGFGMPVLDDVLVLDGDPESLWVRDIDTLSVSQGTTVGYSFDVKQSGRFRVVLAWIDPPGAGSDQSSAVPRLVNDLDLKVVGPGGEVHLGNDGLTAVPDRLNNLEVITIAAPDPGRYTVVVEGHAIRFGSSQSAAIVISGKFDEVIDRRRGVRRR